MTNVKNQSVIKDKGGTRKQLFNYIKLQTTLSFRSNISSKKSSRIVSWILKALILIAVLGLVYFFTYRVVSHSNQMDGRHTVVAIVTITQILLLIYSISLQMKRLYKPDDIRIITMMPLTPFQRYLGEIITIYIKLCFYTLIIFWPVMLIYGAASSHIIDSLKQVKIMNVQFVFASLLVAILIPMFPFALSLVISVPFMLLGDYLKDKTIAKLIIFIVLFVGILVAYGILLRLMADLYTEASSYKKVLEGIKAFLVGRDFDKNNGGLNGYYNPCSYLSELCLANNKLRSMNWFADLAISLAFILAFGAAGIAITKPLYTKFTNQNGVIESATKTRIIKLSDSTSWKSIFVKEFKQIIRTPAYAYFFVGVAVSMPVMTFIITDLIQRVGESSVGPTAFFGFSLLVICIIVSLIGSYSANVISREGKQFYITKISPIPFRKQMFVKGVVNFIVAFAGLLLSIIVIAIMTINKSSGPSLSFGDVAMLFAISTFFLIGITFNGMNIELVRPKIDMLGSETNESNIVIQIVISLVVTALISIFAIAIGGIYQQASIYMQLIVLGVIMIYALINFLIWYFTCEKKYANIEIK